MASPFDNLQFNQVPNQQASGQCTFAPGMSCDLKGIIQMAQRNPQWLEQEVKRMNPQGYQMAMQIKQSANPMQAVMQLAQANRVHPSILNYLGLR